MKTITGIALFALLLSMILTTVIRRIATRMNLVDGISERKVHAVPVPRLGGVAIFLSFFLAFIPMCYFETNVFSLLWEEERILYLIAGVSLAFGLGLWDDLYSLRAKLKFSVQIVVALIFYIGGIKISSTGVPGWGGVELGWLSFPVTLFWVLLVINAINLIDGLDGLAAGISLFVCLVLLVLCVLGHRFLLALILAGLCGSIIGFLWFNFNPAMIFMGDSGSYFLGSMLAGLSMLGSIKGHTAVTFLIPVIAMGVPLMDTAFAAVRRFLQGRGMFTPDSDHFHHRLLKLGYSHRNAVLILYFVSICVGVVAISVVYLHDSHVAVLMVLLFAVSLIAIRKLGYVDYINGENLARWGQSISNEIGTSKKRRLLNAHQIAISNASDIEAFWESVVAAMDFLFVDYIRLQVWSGGFDPEKVLEKTWHKREITRDVSVLYQHNRLYIRFPFEKNGVYFGNIILSKEAFDSEHEKYLTLSHIEHLRRTIADKLDKVYRQGRLKRECISA